MLAFDGNEKQAIASLRIIRIGELTGAIQEDLILHSHGVEFARTHAEKGIEAPGSGLASLTSKPALRFSPRLPES